MDLIDFFFRERAELFSDRDSFSCKESLDSERWLKEFPLEQFDEINMLIRVDEDSPFFNHNAYPLLCGCCDRFAASLHAEFGYEVYEIVDEAGGMVHRFCLSEYEGERVFVDARGATTEPVFFLSGSWARYASLSKCEVIPLEKNSHKCFADDQDGIVADLVSKRLIEACRDDFCVT